jgi:hypothetical protein
MSTDSRGSAQDAAHHVQHVTEMLETVISHVQGDLEKIADPKARALFKSAADVLIKLKSAFDEFDGGWDSQANLEAQTRPTDSTAPKPKEPPHATEVYAAEKSSQKPTSEAAHARTTPPAPELAGFEE